MTDAEKKVNPKFFVTQGYLKTIPYKEAWAACWVKMTEADKKNITDLQNFDAVVFHEITGIDLSVDTGKLKHEMIIEAEALMEKGRELLAKAKGICG